GLFAGFFVSQGRSSPASCRLMSSGSSVRKRMRPCSRTLSGRFSIFRSSNESIKKMSPGPDTPNQATVRPRLHSIVPPTQTVRFAVGVLNSSTAKDTKSHEGANSKDFFRVPLCPLWLRARLSVADFIFARIGQRLEISPGEYVAELIQQRFVHQAIRGQRLAAVELEWSPVETAGLASSFFDDEHTRRRIPGIQVELPKTVEASAGHIAQVECRRSCPPYSMSMQRDLVVEINIRILVPLVAGKSSSDQT